MRAIASGVSLARRLDTDYSIVWRVNDELFAKFEDVFAAVTEVSDHIVYPGALTYGVGYSMPRKKNLYITALTLRRYGLALDDTSAAMRTDDEVERLVGRCIAAGRDCYIQSGCIYHHFDEDLYRSLFKPAADIEVRLPEAGELTGLHIRRTDNVESIRHSPDEMFIARINEIRRSDPQARFYLATDDSATKEKFKSLFGDIIVTGDFKAERNTVGGIADAVTEMFVLSRCRQIIGSHYSSFSEAAAMLGGVPLVQLYR